MTKQYSSENINELAAALSKAQGEMGHAGKTADNPFYKSKYADLSAVIDAAKPALSKHGLSVVQIPDVDEQGNVMLITQLCHASGQWIRGWYPVKPIKVDPQGLGSALTYSRRYAYGAITGVAAADEDDDGNAASGKNDNSATNGTVSARSAYGSSKAMKEKWTEIRDALLACSLHSELDAVGKKYKADLVTLSNVDRQLYDSLVSVGDQRRKAIAEVAPKRVPVEEGGLIDEEIAAQAEMDAQIDRLSA